MGSDDLFKKRREARTQRKHEYKPPKANSYLIVTEGERTEPLYFKGMQKLIQEKVGGVVDIIEQPLIDVHGEGCSTTRLVEVADQIIKDAKIIYQNVWIVFDKDDFDDFDQAIQEAINRGYNVAWSNQSFEYWLWHTKKKTLRNGQPNGLKQMPGVKRKSEEKEVLRQSERLLSMSDRRN